MISVGKLPVGRCAGVSFSRFARACSELFRESRSLFVSWANNLSWRGVLVLLGVHAARGPNFGVRFCLLADWLCVCFFFPIFFDRVSRWICWAI